MTTRIQIYVDQDKFTAEIERDGKTTFVAFNGNYSDSLHDAELHLQAVERYEMVCRREKETG